MHPYRAKQRESESTTQTTCKRTLGFQSDPDKQAGRHGSAIAPCAILGAAKGAAAGSR